MDWDCLLDYIGDELANVQALRAVCRACVTEAMTEALCHLAFREKPNLVLDLFSNPQRPIWSMCIALYSQVQD